jgi:hypothetical protein
VSQGGRITIIHREKLGALILMYIGKLELPSKILVFEMNMAWNLSTASFHRPRSLQSNHAQMVSGPRSQKRKIWIFPRVSLQDGRVMPIC